MAAPFVLSIETALRPPTNVKSVAKQIATQLGSLDIGLSQNSINTIAKAEANLRSLGTSTKRVTSEFKILGKAAAETFQRFFGFTVIISQMYALAGAVKSAASEAVDFDKELIKIKQVSGASADELKSLSTQIGNLSTKFGVSSKELLNASQIFAQAGLSIKDTQIAVSTLALTDLSPTFKNMANTAETAIAIMSQFKLEAKDLAGAFESIDAVSAKFAVEAEDLNVVIRRAGGAFEAAGGSLNELLALFTSVRATTRESAESISTALRTIFARLQRPKTQSFLQTLGIDTSDNGEFKGPLEAIKAISNAVKDLPKNDIRFAGLVEELGGVRQLSKVIPLIKEYGLAQEALIVAETAQGRLALNAKLAQESLASQMSKTKESFLDLARTISSDQSFKFIADNTLKLSQGIIQASKHLKEILPLIAAVGAASALPRLVDFHSGFTNRLGFGSGSNIGNKVSGGISGAGFAGAAGLTLLSTFGQLDNESKKLVDTFAGLSAQLFTVHTGLTFLSKDLLEKKSRQTAAATANLTDVESQISSNSDKFHAFRSDIARLNDGGTLDDKKILAQTALEEAKKRLSKLTTATGKLPFNRTVDVTDTQERLAAVKARQKVLDDRLGVGVGATKERNKLKIEGFLLEGKLRTQDTNKSINKADEVDRKRQIAVEKEIIAKNQLIVGDANTRQGQIKELDAVSQATQARIKELSARKAMLQKEIAANNRLVRQTEIAVAAVSVLSVVASGAGQFLSQAGRSQLETGNAGGRNNFVAGSALQGAATGAGLGAALGTAIAPGVGTAIGAAGGAAIGGGIGLIQGAHEAERILENVRFTKATTELANILKETGSGRSNPLFLSGSVTSNVRQLRQSLATADVADKGDRLAGISNAITPLTQFANQIAKTSTSLDEFKTKLSPEVFQFLVDFGGSSVKKLEKDFQDLINATVRLKNVDEEFVALQERQFERLVEVNNFASAIEDSVGAIEEFNSALDGTRFNSKAGVFNRNTSSSVFGRAVDQTLSPFGNSGKQLASEAKAIQGITQQLPNVLLKLSKSDPFGQGSDFNDKLRSELSEIPAFIREAIVNQADSIIGGDEKDAKIIDAITHDLSGTVNKLTSGFNEILSPLSKMHEAIASLTNDLIGLSDKSRELSSQARQTRLKTVDISEQKARFGASFADTPFINNGVFEGQRRTQVLGIGSRIPGAVTPSSLAGSARALSSSIEEKNLELQNTNDATSRAALIQEINKEKEALARANEGLDFLSDASARAAGPLEELARLKGIRENRADLTKQVIFGDTETRRNIRRNLAGAAQLSKTGDINSIPESDRQGVLGILEKFGNDKRFGGLTGKEVIQKTADKLGLGDEFKPTLEEIKKSIEINKIFDDAVTANGLKGLTLEQQSVALLTRIDKNTDEFNKRTEANLRSSQFSQLSAKQGNLVASSQTLGAQVGERDNLVQALLPSGKKFDNEALDNLKKNLGKLQELKAIQEKDAAGGAARNILKEPRTRFLSKTGASTIAATPILKLVEDLETGKFVGGIGNGDITNKGFNNLLDKLTKTVGKDFSDKFKATAASSLKFDTKGNVVASSITSSGAADLNSLLISELEKLATQAALDRKTFDEKTKELTTGLGVSNIVPILEILPQIQDSFDKLPVNLKGLDTQFQDLNKQLSDVNKSLTTNFKPELFKMFNDTVEKFAGLPMSIDIAGKQTVEVIFNGAEVFKNIQPEMANLIEAKIGKAINDLLKAKFPGVGGFNPPKEAPAKVAGGKGITDRSGVNV